jgi:AcrR family transcriptional regulator
VADVANVASASSGIRPDGPADGRTARSQRTRASVVDALLDLLDAGNPRPTAREIAARAGVSLRSVYVHFDDLEDLFLAAAGRQLERILPLIEQVPADGPLGTRLGAFVEQHCRVVEAAAPVRHAALLQAPFSPTIAEVIRATREASLAELEVVFATELARREEPARRRLLLQLEIASSSTTWETLRAREGLGEDEAREVMTEMLVTLLDGGR